MTKNILHLTQTDYTDDTCFAICQGSTFCTPQIYIKKDYTTWTPRGQIRQNYADLEPVILANFIFDPIIFASVDINGDIDDRSLIIAKLPATVTELLPITPLRRSIEDRVRVGVNVWVYDIELEDPSGVVDNLVSGYVEVLAEVTR